MLQRSHPDFDRRGLCDAGQQPESQDYRWAPHIAIPPHPISPSQTSRPPLTPVSTQSLSVIRIIALHASRQPRVPGGPRAPPFHLQQTIAAHSQRPRSVQPAVMRRAHRRPGRRQVAVARRRREGGGRVRDKRKIRTVHAESASGWCAAARLWPQREGSEARENPLNGACERSLWIKLGDNSVGM